MGEIELVVDDYVQLEGYPNLTFRIYQVQKNPPRSWLNTIGNRDRDWRPRARIHCVAGAQRGIPFDLYARWEPIEALVKLSEMEVLARMAE